MGDRQLSYSILMVAYVFFSNILLMNYLIAILSTTYDNMQESGIFRYKVNLYQYCERFMIAFNERSYGEIVLHPPPLSYLAVLMVPFIFCSSVMTKVSLAFSFMMFWFENVIFLFIFLVFEMVIGPIAYLKVWINILKNSLGLLNTILNCVIWAIIGVPLILFLALRDICYLIKILTYHYGCTYGKIDELAEEEVDGHIKIRVYNETRATVISLYKRLQKHIKQGEDEN